MAEPTLPAQVGEVVSGYRLESVLGRGGMGCVFKATHIRLGRKVALKFLAAGLAAEDELVSRFLSEAKIVNDVRHPNIVDISDFIELSEPRRVAYVMELIDGPSLGAVLKNECLSLRQAINVLFQLAGALEAVHAVNVVHRDLKPDNILVCGDLGGDLSQTPSVKILDFGIAKSSHAGSQHKTLTGSMLGTPSYMAPEQIAAEPVSPATDIYALGEIFYEMITGRRVFHGEQMVILRRKLIGEIPPLSLPEDLPAREAVESLIRSCLALDQKQRPSMHDFCGILSVILAAQSDGVIRGVKRAHEPQPAPTPMNLSSVVGHPVAVPVRRPVSLIGLGIACFVLAGTLGAFVVLRPPNVESVAVVEAAPPAVIKEEVVPEKLPEQAPPPQEQQPLVPAPEPVKKERVVKTATPKSKAPIKKKQLMPW